MTGIRNMGIMATILWILLYLVFNFHALLIISVISFVLTAIVVAIETYAKWKGWQ